eukprot:CAMPEP_0113952332 /NCGR_PEP_ID=MMETSP1339-20121228/90348_1 /TAXON_ID=94617 /ORGANISM="Fibrocapsa japonica" /LENGTH=218 /DNA_ID=CAMNT_0000960917 /DNA_START=56 /DNA_END=712 /DNA_ORIENTATION=- /assembly_acc=CAM_ASM_000762
MARTQNKLLAKGVYAFSKGSVAKKNGRFKLKSKSSEKSEKVAEKKGREPRFYPADDVKVPLKRTFKPKTAKLRENITPGTVLILLSGRFRGKRVIFLKQLPSGTLLVTGPYKVNGVPLRRVNQAYVISTSTKIDISGVSLPDIDDSYFARVEPEKKADEEQFFATAAKTAQVSDQRKADQKTVDSQILKIIAGEPALKAYLNAKFSLAKKDLPHEMKF